MHDLQEFNLAPIDSLLNINEMFNYFCFSLSELFAEFFASFYIPSATPTAAFTHNDNSSLAGFLLTKTDLLKTLSELDGSKGCTPDLIPPCEALQRSSSISTSLKTYGISGPLLAWLQSYIEEIRLHVRFCGATSSVIYATSENQHLSCSVLAEGFGVLMTESLCPSEYVHICSKAYTSLGLIRHIFSSTQDPNIMKILYCALSLPILDYASAVWTCKIAYYEWSVQDLVCSIEKFLSQIADNLSLQYTTAATVALTLRYTTAATVALTLRYTTAATVALTLRYTTAATVALTLRYTTAATVALTLRYTTAATVALTLRYTTAATVALTLRYTTAATVALTLRYTTAATVALTLRYTTAATVALTLRYTTAATVALTLKIHYSKCPIQWLVW
ncbi:hypothetical protein J6590_065968 [Homalodisca vitripennis]|nr:hypothetical protein J6590_065968 [Homalodisca vitripennis]